MDLSKIIAELRTERDVLEEAIVTLERLAGSRRARGRPPSVRASNLEPEILQVRAASANSEDTGSTG